MKYLSVIVFCHTLQTYVRGNLHCALSEVRKICQSSKLVCIIMWANLYAACLAFAGGRGPGDNVTNAICLILEVAIYHTVRSSTDIAR